MKMNRNRPDLSPEEITRMRDFGQVLKGAGIAGLAIFSWPVLATVGTVAVVATGIWINSELNSPKIENTVQVAPQAKEQTLPTEDESQETAIQEVTSPAIQEQAPSVQSEPQVVVSNPPVVASNEVSSAINHSLRIIEIDEALSTLAVIHKGLKTQQPVKPKQPMANRPSFNIDFLPSEFPELADFKNLTFEVHENSLASFSPDYYNMVWSELKLERHQDGLYKITLIEAEKNHQVSLLAIPILPPSELNKALNDYEAKQQSYRSQLDFVEREIERLQAEKAKLSAQP